MQQNEAGVPLTSLNIKLFEFSFNQTYDLHCIFGSLNHSGITCSNTRLNIEKCMKIYPITETFTPDIMFGQTFTFT